MTSTLYRDTIKRGHDKVGISGTEPWDGQGELVRHHRFELSLPGDPGASLGWEDPLEKEVATHSSILAWRIPWTEEPGGLQSMGSHRVRHN